MRLAHYWPELSKLTRGEVRKEENVAPYTSMRVGGASDCLCLPVSEEEVLELINFARCRDVGVTILGQGTNVVVSDRGIRGITLKLERALDGLEMNDNHLHVGAGVPLAELVSESLRAGLVGLEKLAGIPGSVGGAVMMNAGTKQGSIGEWVDTIRVYDIEEDSVLTLSRQEANFGYRSSNLQERGLVVLAVDFELREGNTDEARRTIQEYLRQRATSQPLEWPNAGSIFKNPPGDYAGRLIEEAGLKGLRVGAAEVSRVHANFIVNLGEATAGDVYALICKVRKHVHEKTGVRLETEVRLVGDWRPDPGGAYKGAVVAPAAQTA
jgi:UDP-N-acetylmuramate dehydrogenase